LYVIVGLGNPGEKYANTRHNVGFKVIDLLAKRNNIKVNKIKFQSLYGEGNIAGKKVALIKPITYMNNSGVAVREIKDFYKLEAENILVIVDDVDIKFASIRIRKKGSAGSHNGLKSIIQHIRTENFPRIKLGIGQKSHNQDLADFVLGEFSKEEESIIEDSILLTARAVETMLEKGIHQAMNEYNKR